ncbi:NAD(P)/FAD-dependent oxidoreductase [Humitalea sp. 24SJ18S-53]|uniref:NAD(P)/FAD-dependent oxidoreductase n=1 Tax=Humitalea sp. 24SJ18S-53 TaxID=3422307 RepID=UPI003D66EF3C
MAVACGLARAGREVVVFDEDDLGIRASRGNAGLIWVQGKGDRYPDYAVWTRQSSDLWPGFAAMLAQQTGIDVEYEQTGGFHFCINERELELRAAMVAEVAKGPGANGITMVDRDFIRDRVPLIGERVIGASWSPLDGMANPLLLLRALHALGRQDGVAYRPGDPVRAIAPLPGGGFRIDSAATSIEAAQVILAAGLGNPALGLMVGLDVPVGPVRGQIVVTERLPRFLPHPTPSIRQNRTGTVMFGLSAEPITNTDRSTRLAVTGGHAQRALVEFPHLAAAQVVRSWAALRIMPRDEQPIYDESPTCPGAFVVTCHSGVTLAAVHCLALAPSLAESRLPPGCEHFVLERFHASPAATA